MCDLERSGLLWGKVREMRISSMQLGQGMSVKVTHQKTSQTELDIGRVKDTSGIRLPDNLQSLAG